MSNDLNRTYRYCEIQKNKELNRLVYQIMITKYQTKHHEQTLSGNVVPSRIKIIQVHYPIDPTSPANKIKVADMFRTPIYTDLS